MVRQTTFPLVDVLGLSSQPLLGTALVGQALSGSELPRHKQEQSLSSGSRPWCTCLSAPESQGLAPELRASDAEAQLQVLLHTCLSAPVEHVPVGKGQKNSEKESASLLPQNSTHIHTHTPTMGRERSRQGMRPMAPGFISQRLLTLALAVASLASQGQSMLVNKTDCECLPPQLSALGTEIRCGTALPVQSTVQAAVKLKLLTRPCD